MIVFHPEAKQELLEAAAYYEEQLTDLGNDFLTIVEKYINLLEENPEHYYVSHPRLNIRRCVVPRFPFLIYYRNSEDLIEIFAIAHQSRKPNYWQKRTSMH